MSDLNTMEAGVVCQLRGLVELDQAHPDQGVVLTVTGAGRDYRSQGAPFNVPVVLAVLYPGWVWTWQGAVYG